MYSRYIISIYTSQKYLKFIFYFYIKIIIKGFIRETCKCEGGGMKNWCVEIDNVLHISRYINTICPFSSKAVVICVTIN